MLIDELWDTLAKADNEWETSLAGLVCAWASKRERQCQWNKEVSLLSYRGKASLAKEWAPNI